MQHGILVFMAMAHQGASALGLSELDAVGVVLTLQDGALVIQFKEK